MPRPLLCVSLLLLIASTNFAEGLSAGFGEKDVSPKLGDKPVYIAGFGHNRIAKKIHDPLMARAVVLSDGKTTAAFVCVDVVGLFHEFAARVRKRLPKLDYLCVSSTHNHEGPDTLGLWGKTPFASGIDDAYMKLLEDGIVEAVELAEKNRKPATAKIGTIALPELVADNRLPELKHDTLVAIRFDDPAGKPIGVWVQWNNHPETMAEKNVEITSDFVASTVAEVARVQRCPVAYVTGTVGGLMTTLKVPVKNAAGVELKDGTWEKTELLGRRVGEGANEALKTAVPVTLTPFDIRTKALQLPVANELYKIGWRAGVLKRTFYKWENDPDIKAPVEAKDLAVPGSIKTEIGYARLGELEIAIIPGEIYPELVLGKVQDPADPGADFPDAPVEPSIYGQLKSKHKMLIGLGNDEIGYILPKRQWDAKAPYCYGLKKDQYGEMNSVGPETGPIICKSFADLMNGVKPK
jgi:hypothetical protein